MIRGMTIEYKGVVQLKDEYNLFKEVVFTFGDVKIVINSKGWYYLNADLKWKEYSIDSQVHYCCFKKLWEVANNIELYSNKIPIISSILPYRPKTHRCKLLSMSVEELKKLKNKIDRDLDIKNKVESVFDGDFLVVRFADGWVVIERKYYYNCYHLYIKLDKSKTWFYYERYKENHHTIFPIIFNGKLKKSIIKHLYPSEEEPVKNISNLLKNPRFIYQTNIALMLVEAVLNHSGCYGSNS